MAMQITGIVFGIISLILAQFTSIPQLIELKKTRNSSGISLWTYIIFNITSIFWVVWSFGFYFNQVALGDLSKLFQWSLIPAVIMNVSNIFTMSYVLMIKISYMSKAKKLKISELELSKILLAQDLNKYCNDDRTMNNFKRYFSLGIYLTIVFIILLVMTLVLSKHGNVKLPGAENWETWVIVVNAIGAVSWEAVSWPQFIKSIREKDTTGVSLGWAVFLPVSCTIMVTYDFIEGFAGGSFNKGILFSLIFNGMISSYGVLILKLINMRNAKKHNMSEIDYTKKYLIPEVIKKKQAKMRNKKEA